MRLYIKPHIGSTTRLDALRPLDVTKMLRSLDKAGLSPTTASLARKVLRHALERAEQEGLVTRNVAGIADGPKMERHEGRSLTVEQGKQLLDHVREHRLAAAFIVSLGLGLRRGELLGLRWEDFDEKTGRLKIAGQLLRQTVRDDDGKSIGRALVRVDSTKTDEGVHVIALPPAVADALKAHRVAQKRERLATGAVWPRKWDSLIFRSERGTPIDPDNWRRLVYEVTVEAGLGRWSPHELRHSSASILLAMDVPLMVVSDLLGHSSTRVTAEVYAHLLGHEHAEAADKMQAALWT